MAAAGARLRFALIFLAGRRWASVELALAVEAAALVARAGAAVGRARNPDRRRRRLRRARRLARHRRRRQPVRPPGRAPSPRARTRRHGAGAGTKAARTRTARPATLAERTGLDIRLEARSSGRASDEIELTLYRVIQDAASVAVAVANDAHGASVLLDHYRGAIIAVVEQRGGGGNNIPAITHEAQRERLRLLGGTLPAAATPDGGRGLRAEVPLTPRPAG
jgi:hypothetical protein